MPGRAEPVQGPEGDEAVTGPHVKQRLARGQMGLIQHRIPHRIQELGEIGFPLTSIAAESYVEQPTMPAVRAVRHAPILLVPSTRLSG